MGARTIGPDKMAPRHCFSGVSISIGSVFQERDASDKSKVESSSRFRRNSSGVVVFLRRIDNFAAPTACSSNITLELIEDSVSFNCQFVDEKRNCAALSHWSRINRCEPDAFSRLGAEGEAACF